MSKICSGGGVFPNNFSERHEPELGLSKRNYFAAKAMQALVSIEGFNRADRFAELAYVMADAMVSESLKEV